MRGTPTNNKKYQETMKKKSMMKYGNDKKVASVNKNVEKMMGDKMMGMKNMASIKAKMAMKPSMMRGRLLA